MRERGIFPDTAKSLCRGLEVLAAINTLSIHTKLKQLGIADEERVEPSLKAEKTLGGFLGRLKEVVERVEKEKDEPLTGVSPRLTQLARSFVAARGEKRRKRQSDLVVSPISKTIEILNSADKKDQPEIVARLSDLRDFIEGHIAVDAREIFIQI